MTGLRDLRGKAAQTSGAQISTFLRAPKHLQRFDLGLLVLLALIAFALFVIGYFGSLYVDRAGYFDPKIMRPAPDNRKLTNLRNFTSPIVDAALLPGTPKALVARADGTVHRFDIQQELFGEEALPKSANFSAKTHTLSVACPDGSQSCAQSGIGFLTTKPGGIAMRDPFGKWRVLLGDQTWIGLSGAPVEQASVTEWAVSADGQTVLVLAGAEGAALFDQSSGSWKIPAGARSFADRGLQTNGAFYFQEQFWVATEQGLFSFDPRQPTGMFKLHTQLSGNILDLDLGQDGSLRVLMRGACQKSGLAGCLTLSSVTGPTTSDRLVGENAFFDQLSAASISHASMQSGQLVVLGKAGVYSYSLTQRNWIQLHAAPVNDLHAVDDGERIVFAAGPSVGEIKKAQMARIWNPKQAPIKQVLAAQNGDVLALGKDGNLYNVSKQDTQLTFRDSIVPEQAVFTTGATYGSNTVLIGPDGAWIHNVTLRRNNWIDRAALPPALQLSDPGQLYETPKGLILVNLKRGEIFALTVTAPTQIAQLAIAQVATNVAQAPFQSALLGDDGLRITDTVGRSFQLVQGTQPSLKPLIGRNISDLGSTTSFVTATQIGDDLLFADKSRIWRYSLEGRDWTWPLEAPPNTQIKDLSVGDTLYALSEQGQVFQWSNNSWAGFLGTGASMPISHSDVTDSLEKDGWLYLAGAGQVVAYDIKSRVITRHWKGGNGAVKLLKIANRQPVWIANSVLRQGGTVMAGTGLIDAWSAPDGVTALMENPVTRRRHLRHFAGTSTQSYCVFAGVGAPSGDVIATRRIDADRLLVATTQGAGLYNHRARRWLKVEGLPKSPDLRLDIAEGYLIAHTPGLLRTLQLTSFPRPQNCFTETIAIPWQQQTTSPSIEFDPSSGQFLILTPQGGINFWRAGQIFRWYLPANTGPASIDLKRMRKLANGDLLFVSLGAVWLYDVNNRQWSSTPFVASEATSIAITDLVNDVATLTVWDRANNTYSGKWTRTSNSVTLKLHVTLTAPMITTDPAQIRDMAQHKNALAITSPEGIEFGTSNAERLTGRVQFAGQSPTLQPYTIGTHPTLIAGPETDPSTFWILPGTDQLIKDTSTLANTAFKYAPGTDRDYTIAKNRRELWRIRTDGALLKCPMTAGRSADQTCQQEASAPFNFQGADLLAAYPLGANQILFFENRTLAISSLNWRDPKPIPKFTLRADDTIYEHLRSYFIWRRSTGELFRLDEDLTITLLSVDVRSLRKTRRGLVVGSRQGVGQITSRELRFAFSQSSQPMRGVSLSRDRALVGVLPDGKIRDAFTGQILSGNLNIPTNADFVQSGKFLVAPNKEVSGWWVQQGRSLNFEYWDTCSLRFDLPALPFLGDLAPQQIDLNCPNRAYVKPPQLPLDETLRRISGTSDAPVFSTDRASFDFFDRAAGRFNDPSKSFDPWGSEQPETSVRPSIMSRSVLHNGRLELEPARIERNPEGDASGVEGGGALISLSGTRALRPWASMAVPWASWNRESRQLDFKGASNPVSLEPEKAIINQRFLPTHPGLGSVSDAGVLSHLNRYGLWQYAPNQTNPVTIKVDRFATPVASSGPNFYLNSRSGVDRNTGRVVTVPDTEVIKLGDITLTHDITKANIDATHSRSGASITQAWSGFGFVHDQRQKLGWLSGQPVAMTSNGLAPLRNFTGFAAGLPGLTTRVLTNSSGSFAKSGARWYRRTTQNKWTAQDDPTRVRELDAPPNMRWTQQKNSTQIQSDESWRFARDGLNFHSDQLISAVSDPTRILYITPLGTHQDTNQQATQTPRSAITAAPPTTKLDARDVTPADSVLYTTSASNRATWDPRTNRWTKPAPNRQPYALRRPVDSMGIRITLRARQRAEIAKEMTRIGGATDFVPFVWDLGQQLPFDRANAIWAEPGAILVATDFGLRRIKTTGVPQAETDSFDLSPLNAPDLRHTHIARPFQATEQIVAKTARNHCAILPGILAQPKTCDTDISLAQRLVTKSDLWDWYRSDDGAFGTYRRGDGTSLNVLRTPQQGRWPHDTLRASLNCEGRSFELWSDGRQMLEGAPNASPLISAEPDVLSGLHCQNRPLHIRGSTELKTGLIAYNKLRYLRRAGGAWTPVEKNKYETLNNERARRVAFDSPRLRLMAVNRNQSYMHRWLDDKWRPLSWSGGLPALDATLGLAEQRGAIVRATPDGLITAPRAKVGRIDPTTLTLRTGASYTTFENCEIDHMVTQDGRTQAFSPLQGDPISIRCLDSRNLITTEIANADINALQSATDDPFVSQTLIDDPDLWTWQLSGAAPGKSGSVSIVFKSEPLTLSGGRFANDEYLAIAVPFPGTMELVSANGWWRHPITRMGLSDATREPKTRIGPDATDAYYNFSEGKPHLCLTSPNTSTRFDQDMNARRTPVCEDWQGADRFWSYRRDAMNQPSARGIALNGPIISRRIEAGRFSDLTAIGAPSFSSNGQAIHVPTSIGIARLQLTGQALGHYAYNEPSHLLVLPNGEPAVLSRLGLLNLKDSKIPDSCTALNSGAASLPAEAAIEKIERQSNTTYRVTFSYRGQRYFPLVDCAASTPAQLAQGGYWLSRANVGARIRHISAMRTKSETTNLLGLQIKKSTARISDEAFRSATLGTQIEGDLRATLNTTNARAFLVATTKDLYLIDKDAAISHLAGLDPVKPIVVPTLPLIKQPTPKTPAPPREPVQVAPKPVEKPAPEPAVQIEMRLPTPRVSKPQADASPLKEYSTVRPSRRLDDTQLLIDLSRDDRNKVLQALIARGFIQNTERYQSVGSFIVVVTEFQTSQGLPPIGFLTEREFYELTGERLK